MLALLSSFPESKESPWFFAGRDLLLLFCLFFYFFFLRQQHQQTIKQLQQVPLLFLALHAGNKGER